VVGKGGTDADAIVQADAAMAWARPFGQTYTRYNDGKSGYLSQSVLPLYFGLGDATKIDRIEVDWPSGQKQVVSKGLDENQTLRITEAVQ
jgi:hypothetical protein